MPLAKTFTELHGNEKYYKLPKHLTAADEDVREIHKGDVMLFDGQYVVVFYQDFQTTYRYTRLGQSKQPMIWTLLWGQVMYS